MAVRTQMNVRVELADLVALEQTALRLGQSVPSVATALLHVGLQLADTVILRAIVGRKDAGRKEGV